MKSKFGSLNSFRAWSRFGLRVHFKVGVRVGAFSWEFSWKGFK